MWYTKSGIPVYSKSVYSKSGIPVYSKSGIPVYSKSGIPVYSNLKKSGILNLVYYIQNSIQKKKSILQQKIFILT